MDCSVFDLTACANLVWWITMVKVQETDILETPDRLQNVFKSAICSMTPLGGLLDNISFQMCTQTM